VNILLFLFFGFASKKPGKEYRKRSTDIRKISKTSGSVFSEAPVILRFWISDRWQHLVTFSMDASDQNLQRSVVPMAFALTLGNGWDFQSFRGHSCTLIMTASGFSRFYSG
ncbi:MAG: hypothetical protein IPH20_27510, partial [Bacteroidales bacterium]|nr:hypothetical protein [Bacteroidales bacterium]